MKIEPCPFCGGQGELKSFEFPYRKREANVVCSHCWASGPLYTEFLNKEGKFEVELEVLEKHAVEVWNKVKR